MRPRSCSLKAPSAPWNVTPLPNLASMKSLLAGGTTSSPFGSVLGKPGLTAGRLGPEAGDGYVAAGSGSSAGATRGAGSVGAATGAASAAGSGVGAGAGAGWARAAWAQRTSAMLVRSVL